MTSLMSVSQAQFSGAGVGDDTAVVGQTDGSVSVQRPVNLDGDLKLDALSVTLVTNAALDCE